MLRRRVCKREVFYENGWLVYAHERFSMRMVDLCMHTRGFLWEWLTCVCTREVFYESGWLVYAHERFSMRMVDLCMHTRGFLWEWLTCVCTREVFYENGWLVYAHERFSPLLSELKDRTWPAGSANAVFLKPGALQEPQPAGVNEHFIFIKTIQSSSAAFEMILVDCLVSS